MGNSLLRCCLPTRHGNALAEGHAELSGRTPTNRVELAASELFTLPGLATAYHTSIVVNGEEFFFSDSGIFWDRGFTSHQGQPSEVIDMGLSNRTGAQLLNALQAHFRSGTYDLIRKNCNSFSDVALHYLLRRRLDRKFSALEKLGQRASVDLLKKFTKGMYVPNDDAKEYDTDSVIKLVDEAGDGPQRVDNEQTRSSPALSIGAKVTIMGLKNSESLNGQGAVVHRFNGINGRWEARLNFTGEVKAFRAENLRPAGELALAPGDKCRVHGLSSEAGQLYNGAEGVVVRYLHENSRYEVKIGEETKAFKTDNLQSCSVLANE